jgi:hypothetical protein
MKEKPIHGWGKKLLKGPWSQLTLATLEGGTRTGEGEDCGSPQEEKNAVP